MENVTTTHHSCPSWDQIIQFYCDPLLDAVAGLDTVAVNTSTLSDSPDIGGAHPIDLVAFFSSCVEVNFIMLIIIFKDTVNMHAGEKQESITW